MDERLFSGVLPSLLEAGGLSPSDASCDASFGLPELADLPELAFPSDAEASSRPPGTGAAATGPVDGSALTLSDFDFSSFCDMLTGLEEEAPAAIISSGSLNICAPPAEAAPAPPRSPVVAAPVPSLPQSALTALPSATSSAASSGADSAEGGATNGSKRQKVVAEELEGDNGESAGGLEEYRRQRRLAKNRRTAAVSRERKKAQVAGLSVEVVGLQHENAGLRAALAARDAENARLKEEIANLSRGASGAAGASAPEPAEPESTLPLVQTGLWSASPSSRQALCLSSSLVLCLCMACHSATQLLEQFVQQLVIANPALAELPPVDLSCPCGAVAGAACCCSVPMSRSTSRQLSMSRASSGLREGQLLLCRSVG